MYRLYTSSLFGELQIFSKAVLMSENRVTNASFRLLHSGRLTWDRTALGLFRRVGIRLLHPQHLDGILTGLTLYRVPLDPLVSIQNHGPEKCQEVRERDLCFFSVLKKNRVPDMGEKWCKKNRVQEFLDSVFFLTISPPHAWDSVFFRALTFASLLSHFL